mmetsp:Transcript_2946/g.7518  ORF Transcript_2946/g.7518 Transcript_2946/m.7518 type:complete len:438 (+) Transcript_2946:203-1516(+)
MEAAAQLSGAHHPTDHSLVPVLDDVLLVEAEALILLVVPAQVLLQRVFRRPAEHFLGLINAHAEVGLAEWELAFLGELHALQGRGIIENYVLEDLFGVFAHCLSDELHDFPVGDAHVRRAIENLAFRLVGLLDEARQHARNVRCVRQCRAKGTVAWNGELDAARDPVEEPVEVFPFPCLRPIDVLGAVSAPGEALLRGATFDAELLVVLLHITRLQKGTLGQWLVHATRAHVGVRLRLPSGNGLLHVLRANILVVENVLTRPDAIQGPCEAAALEIGPLDFDACSLEVCVVIERRLVLLGSAVVDHGHLQAFPSEAEGEVITDLAMAAALVLHDERSGPGRRGKRDECRRRNRAASLRHDLRARVTCKYCSRVPRSANRARWRHAQGRSRVGGKGLGRRGEKEQHNGGDARGQQQSLAALHGCYFCSSKIRPIIRLT